MIEAYFDGCCEPKNPGGFCGYGAVIYKDKERIWDFSAFIQASPETSNNVGEYKAFIATPRDIVINPAFRVFMLFMLFLAPQRRGSCSNYN